MPSGGDDDDNGSGGDGWHLGPLQEVKPRRGPDVCLIHTTENEHGEVDTVSSFSSLSCILNVAMPGRTQQGTQKKLLLNRSAFPEPYPSLRLLSQVNRSPGGCGSLWFFVWDYQSG